MSRIAMIDGVLMPLQRATVSVLDRGFLYGDSVFETLRTYGGQPFQLGEHLARLARSAALVHIDVPVSSVELATEVTSAVRSAARNPESYVRIMLTRGTGELALDPSLAGRSLRVILVAELHVPPPDLYEHGIRAVTVATRRASDGTSGAGAKIGNYLVSVLAIREAKAAGALEALIVDADGRVMEGATSNVFFVKAGVLVTPALDAGILPGITRAILLTVARELGITVELYAPETRELIDFEEVFISSSIRELLSVVAIDDRPRSETAHPARYFAVSLAAFRAGVRELG